MQKLKKIVYLSMVCGVLAACATEPYQAKPLSVDKTTKKILANDINDDNFKRYLLQQGVPAANVPFKMWGIDELTWCALYFHSALAVSKAQLGLANAQIESAGVKQTPILNGNIARSNQANGDKRPWAYGLQVEIPIETTHKRAIKLEQAEANAAASRMDVADTAWQLRSQIAKDLLDYHQNIAIQQLLQNELATQTDIANMLEKRVNKGLAARPELSIALLAQLKSQSALNAAHTTSVEMLAKIASDVGLTLEKFQPISIRPLEIEAALNQQKSILNTDFVSKHLQESALLNRIDIRRALANYAVAEAKIKLEVAKQTPDISLFPGIAFEFGDSIWSLGFSTLLNLLHKNPTLINEAKQLREIEGAQFEALQAQIIGDCQQRYAQYQASSQHLKQAEMQLASQFDYLQKLQKQFDAGLIDRLLLKQAVINQQLAQQQVLAAQFEVLHAANAIENLMQAPLYSDVSMPK